MVSALVSLILLAVTVGVLMRLYKINAKFTAVFIIAAAMLYSLCVCIYKPKMHKPFSINVIEYFIKINDDGSMTTTKKVTKTVIKEKNNQEEK